MDPLPCALGIVVSAARIAFHTNTVFLNLQGGQRSMHSNSNLHCSLQRKNSIPCAPRVGFTSQSARRCYHHKVVKVCITAYPQYGKTGRPQSQHSICAPTPDTPRMGVWYQIPGWRLSKPPTERRKDGEALGGQSS